MDFTGPEAADLINVRCLNMAFLEYLGGPQGEQLRQALPASLRPAVAAMTERHIKRLAAVPFLLLSLSESEDAYWDRLLVDRPVRDLFAATHKHIDPLGQISSAALGFLWQLARKNAYATRLVSGGSLHWCEQLASCTLLSVLQCGVENQELIGPRLSNNTVFWHRLLGAGLSSEAEVRRAAHLCALQTMLTPADAAGRQRFRTAACYSSAPALELRARRK